MWNPAHTPGLKVGKKQRSVEGSLHTLDTTLWLWSAGGHPLARVLDYNSGTWGLCEERMGVSRESSLWNRYVVYCTVKSIMNGMFSRSSADRAKLSKKEDILINVQNYQHTAGSVWPQEEPAPESGNLETQTDLSFPVLSSDSCSLSPPSAC